MDYLPINFVRLLVWIFLVSVFVVSCDEKTTTDNVSSNSRGSDKLEKNVPKSDSVVCWTDQPVLKWEDFQGTVPPNSDFSATARSRIDIRPTHVEGIRFLIIKTFFSKDSSWAKSGKFRNEKLLIHENAHFTLAEIAAKELRMKILDWNGVGDYGDFVQTTYDSVWATHLRRQDLYDYDSGHSLNQAGQDYWNRRIDSLLIATVAFSKPIIRVGPIDSTFLDSDFK